MSVSNNNDEKKPVIKTSAAMESITTTTTTTTTTSDEWLNDFGWNDGGADETSDGVESSLVVEPVMSHHHNSEPVYFSPTKNTEPISRPRPIGDWRSKMTTNNPVEFESELDIKNIRIVAKKKSPADEPELDLIENYLNELAPKIDRVSAVDSSSLVAKKSPPPSSSSSSVVVETTNVGKAWDCEDEIDLDNI